MIDINEIAKTISIVKKNRNTLDLLLEFEGVLDMLHIYAYRNWINGEVIKGPIIEKYWLSVYLMYPESQMPDPDAATRLIKYGCHVFFKEDVLTSSVKIKNPRDLQMDIVAQKHKPKKETSKVFVVKIVMPRHLLSNYNIKKLTATSTDINISDIVDAYDEGLDVDKTARADEK